MASCRYVEGLLKEKPYKTMAQISREYDVSGTSIGKHSKNIIKLFQLKINHYWEQPCDFCGRKIRFNPKRKTPICYTCLRSHMKYIWRKWKRASVCIVCGELNPMFLLPTGHHLLGSDVSITIPICANCHELTKPRSRQSFFLFDNWKFPKTRFTEDNSNLYINVD